MKILLILFVLFTQFSLEKAVLTLTGAADISEISEEEFERYRTLAARPLAVNRCSRSALVKCGILSAYQVESLLKYRSEHGDILSATQLSTVGGFAGETANALSPFIDFSQGKGNADVKLHLEDVEAVAGGGLKIAEAKPAYQWRARTSVEAESGNYGFGAAMGAKSSWSGRLSPPETPGWNLHANAGRWLTSFVAGCFNVRLGQGLLMWTGSTFDSYATPSALMKKPSGIIPYKGWSPSYSLKGGGARMDFGDFSIMPFVSFGNAVEYGGHLSWNHRNGEIGASTLFSNEMQGYSLDFQHTVRGCVLYGEACIKKEAGQPLSPSVLAGTNFPAGLFIMGLRALWSRTRHNATAALSFNSQDRKHSLNLGTTAEYSPEKRTLGIKARCEYSTSLSDKLSIATKGGASLKDKARYTLRQDVSWDNGCLSAGVRADAAYSVRTAVSISTELGYKARESSTPWAVILQSGAFLVDNWDDRIYVYMKDLPGNFSVPALYGRGWWANVCAKVTAVRRLDLCIRLMYSAYPWAREADLHKKPALNAGLQVSWKLF
ncbi:MAG: hypothetical protein MJY49_05195 [Bacteroidales bacterium]|nr:hypothetical protein [Bacteroidales bacterium]